MNQSAPNPSQECSGTQCFFLCLLAFLGMLLSSFAIYAADSKKETELTIQGTVVDEQNNPVPNARVFLDSRDRFEDGLIDLETKTDDEGQFTLKGGSACFRGQTVQAIHSNHLMAQIDLPWHNLENDSDLKKLRLQLKPPRRVDLEVVDSTGKPIANAITGIMALTKVWGIGTTNKQGKIVFLVPHDVILKYVAALSDGHGADYRSYFLKSEQQIDQRANPPTFPDHPVRLKLTGTQPLKVKIESAEGKPIAGIRIAPWHLSKPGQPRPMNLGAMFYVSKLLEQSTNAEGIIDFKWIPLWEKKQVILVQENKEYFPHRFVYYPANGDGTLTIQLKPKGHPGDKVDTP